MVPQTVGHDTQTRWRDLFSGRMSRQASAFRSDFIEFNSDQTNPVCAKPAGRRQPPKAALAVLHRRGVKSRAREPALYALCHSENVPFPWPLTRLLTAAACTVD